MINLLIFLMFHKMGKDETPTGECLECKPLCCLMNIIAPPKPTMDVIKTRPTRNRRQRNR